MGYSIVVILEYMIIGYEFFIVACTAALGIGAFWFAISATKEIKRFLRLINDGVKESETESNELKIMLSEYIHAHGVVKQLSIKSLSAIKLRSLILI